MRMLVALLLITSTMYQSKQLTARDYYDELYKAGGLDNFVDQYVCFRDDSVPTFFLLSDGKAIRALLSTHNRSNSLPSEAQSELKKDFLIARFYHKDIAQEREFLDPAKRGVWKEEISVEKGTIQVSLSLNWDTLRYLRAVNVKGEANSYDDAGKCERVRPDILQHGAEELKGHK